MNRNRPVLFFLVVFFSFGSISDSADLPFPFKGESGETILGYDPFHAVTFSSDGRSIITANSNGLFFWHRETGNLTDHISLKNQPKTIISPMAFSPDGKRFLANIGNNHFIMWDVESGEKRFTYAASSDRAISLAFMPNGDQIFAGNWNSITMVWNESEQQEKRTFDIHGYPTQMVVSPNGKYLLTVATEEKVAILFDIDSGERINTYQHEFVTETVAFSPDGEIVFIGGGEGIVTMWDIKTGEELYTFDHGEHSSSIQHFYSPHFAVSSSGNKIAIEKSEGDVIIWDVRNGEKVNTITASDLPIDELVFSPDERELLFTSDDSAIRLWKWDSGEEIFTIYHHATSSHASIFTGSNKLITYNLDSREAAVVYEWNTKTGLATPIQNEFLIRITDFAILPNHPYALSGYFDGNAALFQIDNGELIQFFNIPSKFYVAALSNNGKYLVTGGGLGSVKLWDVETGKEVRFFEGHSTIIRSIAFAPNQKQILTASGDGNRTTDTNVRLWDVETAEELLLIPDHTYVVSKALFSPNGSTLLTASWDRTAALWDANDGTQIHLFKSHEDWITDASFSPNGNIIATASKDTTAKLWDSESGELLQTLTGHTSGLRSVSFSPDGKQLATSGSDGTRIWDISEWVHLESSIDEYSYYE